MWTSIPGSSPWRKLTPLLLFIQPSLQNTYYANENTTLVVQSVGPCHIYGDPDLYGLGVRLSFYITWGTLIVAVFFKAGPEIRSARRAFNVVALAILINTYISITNGSFAALEMFIVCNLVLTLSFLFLLPISGKDPGTSNPNDSNNTNETTNTGASRKDIIGLSMSSLIHAAFLCSQPWLYFMVPQQGSKASCDAKIWILFTVHISGNGWIKFLKAVAFFAVLLAVVVITAAVYMLGLALANLLKTKGAEQAGNVRREQENNTGGHNDGGPADPSPAVAATATTGWEKIKTVWEASKELGRSLASALDWKIPLLLLYSLPIAFVEKTIRINQIDLNSSPITSTSQLLPLLVASLSAVAVLWVSFWRVFPSAWKQAVEKRARAKPSPEHPNQVIYPNWSTPFVTVHRVGDWLHEDFPSSPLPTLRHPYQSYHTWSQRTTAYPPPQSVLTADV
jgi:hypothetical protein